MVPAIKHKLLAQGLLALSQLAFPLVTYPIVTQALGAAGLGRVNFADSIVQTVLIIASLGIPLYGIRTIAVDKGQPQKQARSYLELMLLQAAAVLPAVGLIWLTGSISKVSPALLWTGSAALAASCFSGDWFLQGREDFLWVAIRSFCIRALTAFLIYRWIKAPADAPLYYALLTGAVVITFMLNLFVILKNLKGPVAPLRPFHHLKKINWVFACYVVASLYTVGDSLILGWLSPDRVVGYYSFGYRLVRMSAMLVPTLGVVFIPSIAFHYAALEATRLRQQLALSQRLIFFLALPLSLAFITLAPELVILFAHAGFSPSINVVRILGFIPLLVSLSHLTGTQLLVSIHKEKIYLIFLSIGFLLNITLDLTLIPFYHEQAAASSNLATEAFITIGTLVYASQKNLLSLEKGSLLYCLACTLPAIAIAYTLRRLQCTPLLVLTGSGIGGGLIYLLLLFRSRWWPFKHMIE